MRENDDLVTAHAGRSDSLSTDPSILGENVDYFPYCVLYFREPLVFHCARDAHDALGQKNFLAYQEDVEGVKT